MLQYTNTGQLREWLKASGYARYDSLSFGIKESEFNRHCAEIRVQHPDLTLAQLHDRAALRCILLANSHTRMDESMPISGHYTFDDSAILSRLDAIIAELSKPQPEPPAPVVHVEPVTIDGTPAQIHVSPPQVHVNVDTQAIVTRLDDMSSAQYTYMKVLLTWLAIISLILVVLGLSAGNAFGQGITVVGGAATDGVAARGNAVVVAGLSGGIVQALSVDGDGNLNVNASVTATVATSGLSISVTSGASTSGIAINPSGGAVHATAPTYTSGTIAPFSFETDGDLRVAATVTPAENQNVNITRVGGVTALASGGGGLVVTGANSDGTTATLMPLRIGGVDSAGRIQDALIGSDGALVVNASGTAITVTDGAGALNVIVDSGTLTTVSTVTTLTNFPDNEPFNIAQFGGTNVTAAGTAGLVTAAPSVVETSAPSATAGTYRALSMTTAGAIRTDASATTQPISGTVTVGTFPDNEPINIGQVGGTSVVAANTAGILSVAPAVATTSAPVRTNNTLGMLSMDLAGALRTAVQSVAGTVTVAVSSAPGVTVVSTPITSGTSVAAGSSTSGININPMAGVVHTTAPVYTNGTFAPLSLEADGDLRVAATLTPSGTQDVNVTQVRGVLMPAAGTGAVVVTGAASSGATATGGPIKVGGVNSNGNVYNFRANTDGALVVDSSGTAQTVTGTVTVTDGAGSLNVIVDSGTITVGTFPDNEPFNIAQFGGSNVIAAGTAGLVTAAPAVVETSAPSATAGTYRAASMTTAGAIRTDSSATTQPVSGTVTVTDGAGSLNVILDSGTLTGITNTVNVNTAGVAVSVVAGVSSSGVSINPSAGVVHSTAPVYTNGTIAPFSFETDGDLRVSATVTPAALQNVNVTTVGGATALASGSGALVVTGANSDGTTATLMPLRIGGVDSAGRIQDALIGSDGVLIVTNGTTATTVTDGAGALNVIVDSGTITVGTFPDNEPFNVAQFGGSNVIAASTAGLVTAAPAVVETSAPSATAGTYRSASMTTAGAIRTDSSATTQPVSGTVTVTDGAGSLNTIIDSGTVTTVSTVSAITGVTTVTGAGTSVGTIRVVMANPDPCVSGYTKGYTAISTTTSSQIITGSTNNYIYVCSLNIGPIGTATNVALVSGTGTVCATSIGGIFGGTTAATGFNIAANGGLTMGNGQGAIARTDTTGEHLCILLSAGNQVSGHITYVLSP